MNQDRERRLQAEIDRLDQENRFLTETHQALKGILIERDRDQNTAAKALADLSKLRAAAEAVTDHFDPQDLYDEVAKLRVILGKPPRVN